MYSCYEEREGGTKRETERQRGRQRDKEGDRDKEGEGKVEKGTIRQYLVSLLSHF